jgi:predicted amidohydrolase
VVLPEIWNVGYFAFLQYAAGAEPIDGQTASRRAALADERVIHLHAGSIVEAVGEDLYSIPVLRAGRRAAGDLPETPPLGLRLGGEKS